MTQHTSLVTASTPQARQPSPAKTNAHYIVIEDWDGEYWEGAVVTAEKAPQLRARGVKMLPYEPTLGHVGNGGYFKRSWGGGYPLDFSVPRMCAPLTIFCKKDFTHFEWSARIMPNEDLIEAINEGKLGLEGMIRMASDSGSPGGYLATLSSKENPVLIKQLGKLDDLDGWVIGGTAQMNIQQEGHYSFALYGMAPGARVVWVAATTAAMP